MKNTKFFSSNSYIFLPTKMNPKVALAIDNSTLSKNSFKLYNPFSRKAQVLKNIIKFITINMNFLTQISAQKKVKSDFVNNLEKLLKESLVVSIYFSTVNDKVVMQLQSIDAKIIGYLKYPLNNIGVKHTKNEIKAFNIIISKKIIEPYILSQEYDGKPFLLLKELNGTIDIVSKKDINNILRKFQGDESYRLSFHPRVVELKKILLKYNMEAYIVKLDKIVSKSTLEYMKVYEHGDFTPWNIIKVNNKYIPFDFEYFVEDGLEYFDIIKYYYQIGKLLKFKKDKELYDFVKNNINILEFKELFELFLIKEIMINIEENRPFGFEENIIKILEKI